MTEFAKAKIGFALALLGALFSIYPLMDKVGTKSFDFFGLSLQIRAIYYSFSLILGLSIYAYALDFLTEKPSSIPHKIGNVLYTIALCIPPFVLLLWLTSGLIRLVVYIWNPYLANVLEHVLSAVISGVIGNLFYDVLKRVISKDKKSLDDKNTNADKEGSDKTDTET